MFLPCTCWPFLIYMYMLQLDSRVNKVMVLYLPNFSVLHYCSLQITAEIYRELSKVASNTVLPTPQSLNREGLIISVSHLAFQLLPIGLSRMLQNEYYLFIVAQSQILKVTPSGVFNQLISNILLISFGFFHGKQFGQDTGNEINVIICEIYTVFLQAFPHIKKVYLFEEYKIIQVQSATPSTQIEQ